MSSSVARVKEKFGVKPGKLWIGGEWTEQGVGSFDQIHPATNETVTSFVEAGQSGVDAAVRAARKAFDEGPWPRMGAKERGRILQKIQAGIEQAKEQLGYLQTLDNGIPITFSLTSRVSANMAVDIFEHYRGWIDKVTGETYPRYTDAANLHYMTYREPVGVVGAIIPWNAPLVMFALKVAPALATGCTIVLKASEMASLAVLRLAEIAAECGLPSGVLNVITGGAETGRALSTHPGIDKISFTGSHATGSQIVAASGSNMKRLSMELGGKNAALVFPDTRDLKLAATSIMSLTSTFLSGQVCSTPSRAVVHRSVVDEFIEHAAAQIAQVRFGDPFDEQTTSAPIISQRQVGRIMSYIGQGLEEGAELVFGGDRPSGELENGNWINPTLFKHVESKMTIAQEEIFGPVLTVQSFETEEEAIAIANDSQYGLSGALWTTDLSRAFRVGRAMRTGTIGINGYSLMPNSPAGGTRRSGMGREGGWATIEAFTELKTLILNLDA